MKKEGSKLEEILSIVRKILTPAGALVQLTLVRAQFLLPLMMAFKVASAMICLALLKLILIIQDLPPKHFSVS